MPGRERYTGKEVQSQVQAFAATLGLRLVRKNTGAARLPGRGGKPQLVRFNEPGTGDLEGVIGSGPNRGILISVECKATGELPTEAQFNRIMELNDAGAIAMWTDSLDTAMEVISHVMKGAKIRYLNMKQAEISYPGSAEPDPRDECPGLGRGGAGEP